MHRTALACIAALALAACQAKPEAQAQHQQLQGRWVDEVAARPAVERGRRVNRKPENDPSFIRERHSAADLD